VRGRARRSNALALSSINCDAPNFTSLICSNVGRRDALLITNRINATVNGDSASDTQVFTYNAVVSGTSTSVGELVFNSTFTATK
jgi:hypothetical protein